MSKPRHYAMPTVVGKLMDIDPIDDAERDTGKDASDPATGALGFAYMKDKHARLNEMLAMNDDTQFQNEVKNYFRIVKSEGFNPVLEVPFKSRDSIDESLFIFWHPTEFLLLVCDTWGGRHHHINSANVYFNWLPKEKKCVFPPHASGGMGSRTDETDFTFSGHYDAREAFRYKLWWLRTHGKTIRWKYQPFLWLLHHGDTAEAYNYDAIMEARLAQLPNEVRNAICLTSST